MPKAFPSLVSNGTLELVVLLLAHLRVLNFAPIVIIGNFPLGVLALILRAVLRTLLLTVLRRRVVGILAGLVVAVVVLILIVVHFVYRPFPILFFAGAAQIYKKILDLYLNIV